MHTLAVFFFALVGIMMLIMSLVFLIFTGLIAYGIFRTIIMKKITKQTKIYAIAILSFMGIWAAWLVYIAGDIGLSYLTH